VLTRIRLTGVALTVQQSLQTVLKQTLKHHELQGVDGKLKSSMLDSLTGGEAPVMHTSNLQTKTMFMKLPLSL